MKLKKLSLATLIALFGSNAMAASNAVPVGPNLGYGDASNKNTIFATTGNPAWVGANLHRENNYGLGLTGGVSVKQKEFNQLIGQYNTNVKPILESGDPTRVLNNLEGALNPLILNTRDNFYLQADINASLPIAISNSSFGGIGFEVSGSSSVRAKVLSTDTPITIGAGPDANTIVKTSVVDAAFYLKTAVMTEMALTYANNFYSNKSGHLVIGAKVKYMEAKLVKSVNGLKPYLEDSINGKDIGDRLNDDFKAHQDFEKSENQFGLDLGTQWVSDNWMAGLTVMNVNSPKFNYTQSAASRLEALKYANQHKMNESVTLTPQGRIEAALFSENRNWTLGTSVDTNTAVDLMNNDYQWATFSASYASSSGDSWWAALVPDVRIGYRKNLVGDENGYITPGFTWGPLNLDLGFSSFEDLGKIANIGSLNDKNPDAPEAFMANIGLEFYF